MPKSVDDLKKIGIEKVFAYEGYYFVLVHPDSFYDNEMWKVNKQTKEISYMTYTDFILSEIDKKATSVSVDVL